MGVRCILYLHLHSAPDFHLFYCCYRLVLTLYFSRFFASFFEVISSSVFVPLLKSSKRAIIYIYTFVLSRLTNNEKVPSKLASKNCICGKIVLSSNYSSGHNYWIRILKSAKIVSKSFQESLKKIMFNCKISCKQELVGFERGSSLILLVFFRKTHPSCY